MPFGQPAEPEVRVSALVNVVFAALGLATDAKVLNCPADHAHRVTFKVGECDQHIRQSDCLGDVGLVEDVPFGQRKCECRRCR